jgi:rhodanese-related sulfurtransferase
MYGSNIKEVSVSEFAQWLNDDSHKLRVIDVRQMQEIAMGTVPTAEALPLHMLPEQIHALSPAEKMVLVCRSGARSAQACMYLQQWGFSNVYNLRGGMIGWIQSGFPPSPLSQASGSLQFS